jgi:hypothetical protein
MRSDVETDSCLGRRGYPVAAETTIAARSAAGTAATTIFRMASTTPRQVSVARVQPSLDRQVVSAVGGHPAVRTIDLAGSRADGRATAFSDWDFLVATDDFPALARDLPRLCAPLAPLAAQWDPLSPHQCWMLMLPGPIKVDLIFPDEPHELEPPWEPTGENLADVDRHFWDWVLWLRSKQESRKHELVAAELEKLFEHLLAPLWATARPESVAEAVAVYREARAAAERRLGVDVPRELEEAVASTVLA